MAVEKQKYDPKKRRERYLRERDLLGRTSGRKAVAKGPKPAGGGPNANNIGRGAAGGKPPRAPTVANPAKARATIARLEGKVKALQSSLTEAMAALAEVRRNAAKTAKENSDGKSTAKEKQASKEYRDKNQEKIAEKDRAEAKKESSSSSGSSSTSSTTSPTSVSDMSESELTSRISKIRATLAKAKTALSDAKSSASFSHSEPPVVVFLQHSAPISRKESVLMTDADFGGWATRHDVQCADGRTILPGAFQHQDGMVVPLVYNHGHASNEDVLGHAVLEYVPPTDEDAGGVYAHGFFNKTPKGLDAKEQVRHGDLTSLSIFANNLREKIREGIAHGKDVVEGQIRELSLVLAGANPGAFIDHVSFAHGDGEYETAAVISMNAPLDVNDESTMSHADTGDETLKDILGTLNEKQSTVVHFLLNQALSHSALDEDTEKAAEDALAHALDGASIEDVMKTLDEAQSTAVGFILDQALTHSDAEESSSDVEDEDENEGGDEGDSSSDSGSEDETNSETDEADAVGDDDTNDDGDNATDDAAGDSAEHNDLQEDNSMTHNVFDQSGATAGSRPTASLQHGTVTQEDALREIVKDAKKNGSFKDALENYVAHSGIMVGNELKHGVENLDYLFPDAQTLENSPAWISRRMEWVDKVLNGVRKSPFSRIKTITADITPDEARARGYIKGNFKNEEFFALSKRETTPQTIYKKQKLDRDDVIDITTLDVIAWLKAEMKVMLDEELAAAILVGDGRSIGDDDKILENHIRPIASDNELYVTTVRVNVDDADSTVEELVDAVISNRRYYKGSGTPTFFTTEGTISAFLTVKDNFGRRLYNNLQDVAAVLRVAEVVPVEVMERVDDLVGIMVNLSDYTLGADRGGQATMFDDFDIDYNKLIYLIETRCSGALTQPKAAIVFRKVDASDVLVSPDSPTWDAEAGTVTVPTVTGVVYKNADTNATLTTAAPVTVAPGSALNVIAQPSAGYYFANSEQDQWTYSRRADA
jgi:HK97 family phage prohead protease